MPSAYSTTHIPEDHDWFGLPYPGTYMLDSEGRVFEKSFFADHCERGSANDFLQLLRRGSETG